MGEPSLDHMPNLADPRCLELVREYCQLATRPSLSEAEAQRLDDLLALAVQDGQLNFWINEADHFIDHAIGLGSSTRVYASVNENLKARLREILDLTPEGTAADSALDLIYDLQEGLTEGTRQVQQQLAKRGYDPGPVDGVDGPKTRQALHQFQRSLGLAP